MSVQFRPAITTEAKPLIGLYSLSGCGKTWSALLLAKGFAGDMSKVGVIETESGRGEVFADDPVVGGYRVCPIRDDFSPKAYGAAIKQAEAANLQVLITDSASHEWEGAGGVLAMAAANEAAGKKGPLVWQQPKIDHQREFVLRLLATPIPLVIVNMRAKFTMSQVTPEYQRTLRERGVQEKDLPKLRDWVRDAWPSPKQSEDILFEMMVHGWIDERHCLHVTKYTKDAFKTIFRDNEPITVDTGKRLAEWAAGRTPQPEDRTLTADERRHLIELSRKAGHEDAVVLDWLKAQGCADTKAVRLSQYTEFCRRLADSTPLTADLLREVEE